MKKYNFDVKLIKTRLKELRKESSALLVDKNLI